MSIKYLALLISVLILNINIQLHQTSKLETRNKNKNKKNSNNNMSNKAMSNTSTNKNNLHSRLKRKQEDYKEIWERLFHKQRDNTCKADAIKAKVNKKIEKSLSSHSHKSKKGKFAWVKQWGFEKVAYFFDFLDPVLLKPVLTEFKKVYDDMFAMSNKDTDKYKDPFDIKKQMRTFKKEKKFYKKNMKKINSNYEPKIYEVSVNAVQIHNAMPLWKWEIDVGLRDYAVTFIKKYDINGDGRLNPRELILGALEHNKHLLGSGQCTHCMEGVISKLEAIFKYLDCDNDGKIKSEDIYANLPLIKRPTTRYDIFAIGKNEGIRTDAVNDFILKNSKMEMGALNKKEFIHGILYGIWDRQTDFFKILDGSERSIRHLRWKSEKTIDVKALKVLEEIKKKEKMNKKILKEIRSGKYKKILAIK
jgi:hypothetical protein